MRNLIFGINMTIDGCCDHTRGIAGEAVHEYFAQLLRGVDTLLYGRKTYELMVPYWPDVAKDQNGNTKPINDFAQAFTSVENIVVCSRTLNSIEGKHTQIIKGNLGEEVMKLKRQNGGNISTGGVDIPSQLIALGLVDELHIVIHPVIAGAGRRFLDVADLPVSQKMELAESTVLEGGFVVLRYMKF
jgi:dihydrofolate reductase